MAEAESTKPFLLDLPVDLLVLIFPYLDVPSFLHLTSTCIALHRSAFVYDTAFWSAHVRHDFRVPNQPVVQGDGRRWQTLYKRLRTQSKIFTWGNDDRGCLGHAPDDSAAARAFAHHAFRPQHHLRRIRHASWPGEMQGIRELGVISDLQSGGWSTTMLTSKGTLHTVGVLDGRPQQRPGRAVPHSQHTHDSPTPLSFPPGMPHPSDRYDPATAIRQFASGRAHVLGLSDSGRIWSWQNIDTPALNVKFVEHIIKEDGRGSGEGGGVVKKVVAGWNKSAALIQGTGIVVWEPLRLDPHETCITDTALVLESAVVPKSSYAECKRRGDSIGQPKVAGEEIGEVKNMIVLSDSVLFCTSVGKAFASLITWTDTNQSLSDPIELLIPSLERSEVDTTYITDIQGAHQSFAVFTRSGAVFTSTQDRLMPRLQNSQGPSQPQLFQRIPALQHKQVISLAFGDYHFHALHAPGYITSYGYEPQGCGALGLGGHGVPEGRLRGIRNRGIGGDGWLVPHAYTEGRRVWFEPEKQEWITFLTSGGVDQREAAERLRMAIGSPDMNAQGQVSEWIEQEGRDWEGKFGIREEDEDGLGAYFALNVSAAGWHSGALVLVNEQMAGKLREAVVAPRSPSESEQDIGTDSSEHVEAGLPEQGETTLWDRAADLGRYFLGMPPYHANPVAYKADAPHIRQNGYNTSTAANRQYRHSEPVRFGASPGDGLEYSWARDHFPRLRLTDGTEMPGEVEFDEWRYCRPEWNLDWESEELGDGR